MLGFTDFLEEQEKFDTTLQYHDKLNPVLWKNEKLNSEVKKALLKIAHDWGKFSKIPDEAIKDIIILGGNCNYNYTSLSDIDLHLVVDMKKIIKDKDILDDWLYDKKVLWAKYHPNIRIKGYPVEMYAQDENQSHKKGQGVYSLQSDSWLVKPVYHKGVEDLYTDPHLINKIKFYIKHIDNLTSDAAYPTKEKAEEIRKLKTKFQQLRNASIQKAGEFSRENLLYKALRNMGKLDKMSQYISNYEDKQYSLAEQKFFTLGPNHGGAWVYDDGGEEHPSRPVQTNSAIQNEPHKNVEGYFRRPRIKKYIGNIRRELIKNPDKIPDVSVTTHPGDPTKHSVIDGNHRFYAAKVARVPKFNAEHIPHENISLSHPDDTHADNAPAEDVYNKGIPLTKFRETDGSYDMKKPRTELGGLTLNHYFHNT